MAAEARSMPFIETNCPRDEWGLITQFLADDISAAIAHKDVKLLVVIAGKSADVSREILLASDLAASIPKCNNFILD